MVVLNIDKEDCENAAILMEVYFFQNIRDDPDIDNIEWARSILHTIDELNRVSNDKSGD